VSSVQVTRHRFDQRWGKLWHRSSGSGHRCRCDVTHNRDESGEESLESTPGHRHWGMESWSRCCSKAPIQTNTSTGDQL